MDRTEYLKLCQHNAVNPRSKKVKFKGCEYYPKSYLMCFDKHGQTEHTAILTDCEQPKSEMWVDLKDVENSVESVKI